MCATYIRSGERAAAREMTLDGRSAGCAASDMYALG